MANPRPSRPIPVHLLLVALLCGPALAREADLELSLAGGASQITLDDDGFDGQWGPYFALSLSAAPFEAAPKLRLGAGVSLEWFSVDVDNEFIAGQADLFLFTPEVRISWRQSLGDRFYLEPGVGVGGVIGVLDFFGSDSGVGYSVRPFLRAGYQETNWSAGAEIAYRFGQLDLAGDEQDINNLSVGLFVAFKL